MLFPPLRAGILENGTTWFVQRNRRPENKFLVCLIVRTGSAHEAPGEYGLAHFIEHMVFNGTATYEGEQLIEELQRLGVGFGHDLNAYTSLDHTVYHLEIEKAPGNLDRALSLLSEFASSARMEPSHIEKERPIILEEKRLRSGRGEQYITLLLEKLFGDSPFARLVIGTEEDISSVQKEDFDRFYRRWYQPDNFAVVVLGDMPEEEAQQGVEKYFGPIPAAPSSTTETCVPTTFRPESSTSVFSHAETATGSLQLFTVLRGMRGCITEEDHEDWMRYVLCEVLSERLQTYISEQSTHINSTQAEYNGEYTRWHDMVVVGAQFAPEHYAEAAELLGKEIARLRRFGPTSQEIQRIASNLRTRLQDKIQELDRSPHWTFCQRIMSSYLQEDSVDRPEADLALLEGYIASTTTEDFLRIAEAIFDPQHLVRILEMPGEYLKDGLDTEIEALLDVSPELLTAPVETVTTMHMESFDGTPLPNLGVLADPLAFTQSVLPSGAKVFLKTTTFQKDRVHLRFVFEAGNMYLPKEQQGLPDALIRFMIEGGSGGKSFMEVNKILQEHNLSISLDMEGPSSFVVYGSCQSAQIDLLCALLYDVMFAPDWRAASWERVMQFMELGISEERANPQVLFWQEHNQKVLQHHPTSYLLTREDLHTWTPEFTEAYHRRIVHGRNLYITAVSSLSVDTLLTTLGRYFSHIPQGIKEETEGFKLPLPFPEHAPATTLTLAHENKGSLRLSFPGVPYLHPDRHLYTLTAEILSDRLRKAVREDMGNTYSIGAVHSAYRCLQGGDLTVRVTTSPEELPAVEARIRQELADLQKGITEDELERAKAPLRTEFMADQQENSFWLGIFVDRWNRVPDTYVFEEFSRLQETSQKELHSFLRETWDLSREVKTVLLPKEKP